MYRALTWKVIGCGISTSDEGSIMRLTRKIKWEFKRDSGPAIRTFVNGVLVGRQILDEKVGRNSSLVAGLPSVRKFMRKIQRSLGSGGGIVMEGRDIGTNVFPNADLKIYLKASARERALRRLHQLRNQGFKADYNAILKSIRKRDSQDARRRINPLRKARDSVVIDTTKLTLREVASRILELIKSKN